MKKHRTFWSMTIMVAMTSFFFAALQKNVVSANNTPQTLPFSQNWTANVITTNDDWSPINGIEGFLGQNLTGSTGTDPRTILAPSSTALDLDVIANQTNPTNISGGIGEFEITNPTIGFQGSGTADAPHLILYLNTTGQSNIRVAYNARDIDDTADNAIQPVNTQYRIGNSGDFINVAEGFVADASTGPSTATLVTPVAVTLPAAASNQALVQVRIMTTNAAGSDEWIGIDDISVTTQATAALNRTNADFDGDGRTDYAVTRDTNTPLAEKGSDLAGIGFTQKYWYINYNGTNTTSVVAWGLSGDREIPEDFDGDGKDDVAIWRESGGNDPRFYILQSGTNTVRIEVFGLSGDHPSVVGDYDGDHKADPAVFRCPAVAGQCYFFFRGSLNNPSGNITYVPWGFGTTQTIATNVGDFDDDGKNDFCIRRDAGGGAGQFVLLRSSDLGVEYINWGLTTDAVIPGDFDGDFQADFTVVRFAGNVAHWYILERDGGGTGASPIVFGDPVQDFGAWGDYDGDGKQDIAVWRENVDPAQNYFFVRQSSNGVVFAKEWGQMGDEPVAEWNGEGGENLSFR